MKGVTKTQIIKAKKRLRKIHRLMPGFGCLATPEAHTNELRRMAIQEAV